jgi:uncharacterized YceG family protein
LARGNRSETSYERTAQERERDRLERERRRAAREGQAPPTAPVPPPEPIGEPGPPLPAGEPAPLPPVAEQPPAEPAPGSAPIAEAAHDQEHEPRPSEPAPWHVDPAALPADGPPEDLDLEHDEAYQSQPDPAPRASGIPGGAGLSSGRGRGRGGGRGRAGREGRPPRRRLTRARVAALLALAAAIALVWFLLSLFQPFAGDGQGRVIVQIPKGSSSSKVGSILAHDDVISSGFFFDLRALLAGKRSSLHSGRFVLKHDMSYSAAIDALSKPPPKVIAVKVVIPEGYTRRQIAELVREDALSGDYLAASERSRLLSPHHYGAPRGTRNLEGFLFPATYDLRAGAPVRKLVDEQLIAFRRRFGSADVRRARALGVTPYEMLTVASMIEREAQSEHDRPLIAAVIYNRLREGIPLGIDATIYYAVELQKGIATYAGELTQSMLKIDSPYNTRTHKGVPPTPISNPGEASIHAAAHPAHVPYLYYVAGADGCGEQVFSKTYAQFEKDVAAYDAAVKKNGGKPPACKKK